MIPYGKQNINDDDINQVIKVLKSDFITQGPAVKNFEEKIAQYVNVKYVSAVNSATSALHIACLSLGLQEGDLLWTSPNSFVASSNCGLYCGAQVDFVDIDPKTYNMSIEALEAKLENAKKLPKILIPVHFSGQSCDMKAIKELSLKYGFKIIEDASHAIGGSYNNSKIGSCQYSDICIFSFHPVKIVTTGEGGAATTNDKEIYQKLELFRTHGITKDLNLMNSKDPELWYYEQIDLGFNYRITDIQAALGASQLKRIDKFIAKRHQLAKYYDKNLQDLPLTIPYQAPNQYSAFHLYVITLDNAEKRKEVFNYLRQKDIGVNVHYIPIHTQPYYKNLGFKKGDFPNSENYYSKAISLPLYYDLTNAEQDYVIKCLKEVLND